jgi:hypothetical protein
MKLNPTLITPLLAVSLALLTGAAAAKPALITSVYSKASPQYKRSWQTDGKPKPEYYVIANGKYEPGTAVNDSIDRVKFPQIAGLVAEYLAKKSYQFASRAEGATLLLQITWGTTKTFNDENRADNLSGLSGALRESNEAVGALNEANKAALDTQGQGSGAQTAVREAEQAAYRANDALNSMLARNQMSEAARNEQNEANARVIGYVDELNNRNDFSRYAGAGATYDDLVSELESARYYVRITAYDFKKLREQNKQEVLWTTVVSVDAQNTRFDEALDTMVANASRQFGQSNGLVRQAQDGTVTLGELKFDGPAHPAKPDEKEKK